MQTVITPTSGPGRVLLVDDHPAVRRVLRSLLEEVGGWQVVGEADSGEAAIPLVEQLVPDVVLMDCHMPGQGGVAATREIVQRWPEVAVVAHTAYADETYMREMVAAGARGDVLKGDVTAAVLEALSAARQGPGPAVGRGHRAGHGGPAPAVRGRGQPLQGAGGRERRPERLGGPAGRRPPQGRVPGHGQPRAADPDHGRPGHGPDPGRAARHGRHRRRPGDSAAGRLPGQTSARHGRAAAPGQRVRGQPQPGAAGRGGHGRRGGGRGGRRLAAGRARPPRRAAPARPAPLPPRATPRPCGWWSATWSTTPASTLRPAPPSRSRSTSPRA